MSDQKLYFGQGPDEKTPIESIAPDFATAPLPPATPLGLSGQSTLEKSSEKKESTSVDASNPTIPFPHQLIQFFSEEDLGSDSDKLAVGRLVDLSLSRIISNMLDAWNDSIKALDAKRKEEQQHPGADEIRKSEERRALSHLIEAVNSLAPHTDSKGISAVAAEGSGKDTIFGAMVVGTLFVAVGGGARDALLIDTLSTSMVGVNPTADASVSLNPYTSDMRAELGLLGAALMQAAMVQANSLALLKLGGVKKEGEITAKSYAEQILTLVDSSQLVNLIQAIVSQNSDPTKAIDRGLVNTLVVQFKLILLSSALAALFKAEKEGGTGWIKKGDFLNLLAGNTFGPNQKLMDQIFAQMNALFEKMVDKGLKIKALLANFYEGNPPLSILTNPAKLFERLHPYFRDPTQNPM